MSMALEDLEEKPSRKSEVQTDDDEKARLVLPRDSRAEYETGLESGRDSVQVSFPNLRALRRAAQKQNST